MANGGGLRNDQQKGRGDDLLDRWKDGTGRERLRAQGRRAARCHKVEDEAQKQTSREYVLADVWVGDDASVWRTVD